MGYENFGLQHGQLVNPDLIPHFESLSEHYPDASSILLDQKDVHLTGLSEDQLHWRDHGYVIKKGFVPDELTDAYIRIREKLDLGMGPFDSITPYLNHSVIRDICCSPELHYLMVDLLGEELGLHFTLANFTSTERGWHQDDYLNPEDTMGRYAAVWIAMEDIDPDSGPFEFVPGSHKWPCMRNGKVKEHVIPELRNNRNHDWAIAAEYFVNKSVESYIVETQSKAEKFFAKKGDILVWHGKLMHRGSIPNNPNLARPALIAHYSNIRNRRDFSNEITRHGNGGYFWEFDSLGRKLTPDRVERSSVFFPKVQEPASKAIAQKPTLAKKMARMTKGLRSAFKSA